MSGDNEDILLALVTEVNKKVDNLSGSNAELDKGLALISKDVGEVKKDISQISESLTEINNKTEDQEKRINTFAGAMEEKEARVQKESVYHQKTANRYQRVYLGLTIIAICVTLYTVWSQEPLKVVSVKETVIEESE